MSSTAKVDEPPASEDAGAPLKGEPKPLSPASRVFSVGGLMGLVALGFFGFTLFKELVAEEVVPLPQAKARELYFTPVQSGIGGLLIGMSIFFMLRVGGRILGISGMISEFMFGGYPAWRFLFLFALFFSGSWLFQNRPTSFDFGRSLSASACASAGFLIGFGALMGNGCTSGHMIAGMSRLAPRSVLASALFMGAGAAVNLLFREKLTGSSYAAGVIVKTVYPDDDRLRWMATVAGGFLGAFLLLWALAALGAVQRRPAAQRFVMNILCLLCGACFAFGLAISGMLRSSKVLGFLDFAGKWDPSLLCVAGGAVVPNMILYFGHVRGLRRPTLAPAFGFPKPAGVDLRLIAGAALFGAGWGVVGLCPGPVMAAWPSLNPRVLYTAVGMIAGMFSFHVLHAAFTAATGGGRPSKGPKAE